MFGIAERARKFWEARDGAVAITMGLALVALLGMAGLASEFGYALYKRQQQQTVADAAAFGGAMALSNGASAAAITLEAQAIAAASGFTNGSNNVTVTVTPTASQVQVTVAKAVTLPLVDLVGSFYGSSSTVGNVTIKASAVAQNTRSFTNPTNSCMLQLGSASPGVTINNGATVGLQACGLTSCSKCGLPGQPTCSPSNNALTLAGGAKLNLTNTSGGLSSSYPVSVSGTASISNGATINNVGNTCSSPCKASQGTCAASLDPYATQIANAKSSGQLTLPPPAPSPSVCSLGTWTGTNYAYHTGNPAYTFSPGTWCNGVTFGQGLTYKFSPGVYYVNQGQFQVGGGATLTGSGVTIVLTGSGGTYANANIGNGATVTFTAPTSGPTAGIVFLGDPNAPISTTNTFQGGSQNNVTGAYYFPSETVVFNNGATSNSSSCTQLIGGALQFAGGMQFKTTNCSGTGVSPIGSSTTQLTQ